MAHAQAVPISETDAARHTAPDGETIAFEHSREITDSLETGRSDSEVVANLTDKA
jgi:hypothetical protein